MKDSPSIRHFSIISLFSSSRIWTFQCCCIKTHFSFWLFSVDLSSSTVSHFFFLCTMRLQLEHSRVKTQVFVTRSSPSSCSGMLWWHSIKPSPLEPYVVAKSKPHASQNSRPCLSLKSRFLASTISGLRSLLFCDEPISFCPLPQQSQHLHEYYQIYLWKQGSHHCRCNWVQTRCRMLGSHLSHRHL